MIYYHFIIISFVVLIFNPSCFCGCCWDMCPDNIFESLKECLIAEGNIGQLNGLDWTEVLNQRIECSKVGLCKPWPWQLLDKKIKLVRDYAKCMNGINGIIEAWKAIDLIQPHPNDAELHKMVVLEYRRCRKNLSDNFPKSEIKLN